MKLHNNNNKMTQSKSEIKDYLNPWRTAMRETGV